MFAERRRRRSRKKAIYSPAALPSSPFFEKVRFPAPRRLPAAARRLGRAPFRAAPSSEGLAIIPRIGPIARGFPARRPENAALPCEMPGHWLVFPCGGFVNYRYSRQVCNSEQEK